MPTPVYYLLQISFLVKSGMSIVRTIENAATDRRDKPVDEVKIEAASCKKLTDHERYVEEFEPSKES